MIDFKQLPHFAPNGYDLNIFPFDGKTMAELLPENETYVWLESHSEGKRFLFLGETWSMEAFPDHLNLQRGDYLEEIALKEKFSYPDFLNDLEAQWMSEQPAEFKLPWVLAYEAGWNTETRRSNHLHRTSPFPELWLACPKSILFQDIGSDTATLLQPKHTEPFSLKPKRSLQRQYAKHVCLSADENKETYLKKITKVKEHIRQGDSFQVNLSQGFTASGNIDLPSWAHFSFKNQASSFGALVQTKNFNLMSLSPERLIASEADKLITRPIAGTLAVEKNQSPNQLLKFKQHPKELAEHNMLIDLERNDLGKVSLPGSVKVEEYLTIESLPHVHHLVSQVIGQKDPKYKFGDILFALFPGGTITGCPKLETMHIIDALEEHWRSFYTGSLGYLGQNQFDSNILIRTAIVHNNQTYMRFGGGLVWDSEPEKEYLETLAKARGLIKSLLDGGADFDPDHRSLRQFFS